MSKSLVYTYLLEAARNRETITYTELARKVGLYGDMPRLFRILDDINRDGHAAGRPMLSAIVVGASGMPGKGFFRLARSLSLYRGIDDRKFWQDEVRRVHNHWGTGRANVQYYGSYTVYIDMLTKQATIHRSSCSRIGRPTRQGYYRKDIRSFEEAHVIAERIGYSVARCTFCNPIP